MNRRLRRRRQLRYPYTAAEREGGNFKVRDIYLKNGSSQGQHPALTVLFAPNSLESGLTAYIYFAEM
jgi:hypothetical protein